MIKQFLLIVIWVIISFADEIDLSDNIPKIDTLSLFELSESVYSYTRTENIGWSHFQAEVELKWGDNRQIVFSELTGGISKVYSDSKSVVIMEHGDRYSGDYYEHYTRFEYNRSSNQFDKTNDWAINHWELYIDTLKGYLDNSDFQSALSIVADNSTSQNGGLTDESSEFFQLFLDAVYRDALYEWRNSNKEGARDIVMILFNLPFSNVANENESTHFLFHNSGQGEMNSIPHSALNTQKVNDIGFFLTDSEHYLLAENLLLQVRSCDSNRAVAYLNLGDLYSEHQELLGGGHPGYWYYYQTYASLMKEQGKEGLIPDRIRSHIGE